MTDTNQDATFRAGVKCNVELRNPKYTLTVDDKSQAEFVIESRLSCGETNVASELFGHKRYLLASLLLALGLVMLYSAGIGVEKLVIYVVGILAFLLLFGFVLSLFSFHLSNTGLGLLTLGVGSIAYLIHRLFSVVKQLLDLVVSIVTYKFAYTYGQVLFPNASFYERVGL